MPGKIKRKVTRVVAFKVRKVHTIQRITSNNKHYQLIHMNNSIEYIESYFQQTLNETEKRSFEKRSPVSRARIGRATPAMNTAAPYSIR